MSKSGIVLVWGMLVLVVISILLGSFFLSTMNENSSVQRHIASIRAFWLAEAGIAQALDNMPSDTTGTLGGSNYLYASNTTLLAGTTDYYTITSTGTVNLPSGGSVSRILSAVVRAEPVPASNFQHAVRTTVGLDIRGSVDINGDTQEYATLNFPDLFENSKAEVEAMADNLYTDPANNITPVNGITWVNLSEGVEFEVHDNSWSGSGILVVSGDMRITGGTFGGILYVIGDLRVSGNPTINGTVLVESDTSVIDDADITGNPTINYDIDAITDALTNLGYASTEIVSWREQ